MKFTGVIFFGVLLQFVACSEVHYSVPQPLFEVFSPKGLRVSIPDCRDIRSVEFSLNVPSVSEALTENVNQPSGQFWVYWNPDVSLRVHDKIHYKLMVNQRDLYKKREGIHIVQKVLPLEGHQNDTDCLETKSQKIISGFPSLDDVEERHMGTVKTGKASNYKSSYSMYKNSDLKPITKSSTSTTSGTFYLKPTGVMEATGYKKESSFDSTKREGEQWQHSESELTAAELENMRQLYGSGFIGLPQLTSKLFPSTAKTYEKSYMSSESQHFPEVGHTIIYGESPLTTHKFHQTHRTHESSSVSHSKPVFQYRFGDSAGGEGSMSSSIQGEKVFRLESLDKLPHPLPPQGTMFRTTEFIKEEHTVPVAESSQVHVSRESHSSLPPQKIIQGSVNSEFSSQNQEVVRPVYTQILRGDLGPQKIVHESQTKEFTSHNQEVLKPAFTHSFIGGEQKNQYEYNSGNLQTVENKQDYRSRHYVGNIFSSVKSGKPKSPQECHLIPGVDYTSSGSIKEVEKLLFELSCLATLAENSIKEEIDLLKLKNSQLTRNYELLEQEVKRLEKSCNCY